MRRDTSAADDRLINPYLLLTPGPLSTTPTVREAMLKDWCTWDDDYKSIVQDVRARLITVACDRNNAEQHTVVLMQGSGTFAVEAAIGSIVPQNAGLLLVSNGAYGLRMVEIADRTRKTVHHLRFSETDPLDPAGIVQHIERNPGIQFVAFVHCETTTGMLNPLPEIVQSVKSRGMTVIVDAMSSFGGIPIDVPGIGIDVLISSANKCIQGVPGFGFVIVRRDVISKCNGNSHSLALDLYDQWTTFEQDKGKWRYTSPTHTVRAFQQALIELEEEGGVEARHQRYRQNHRALVSGMENSGFRCLLPKHLRSPIITSFCYPATNHFQFKEFYQKLKEGGFVVYPGKVSNADTFRIGTIGNVFPHDMTRLTKAVAQISTAADQS